jgi:hypothetical protein
MRGPALLWDGKEVTKNNYSASSYENALSHYTAMLGFDESLDTRDCLASYADEHRRARKVLHALPVTGFQR